MLSHKRAKHLRPFVFVAMGIFFLHTVARYAYLLEYI